MSKSVMNSYANKKRELLMDKIVNVENHLEKARKTETACYVLITCSKPNEKGEMEVELNYDGDESLAAFLVENAAQVFENKADVKESK